MLIFWAVAGVLAAAAAGLILSRAAGAVLQSGAADPSSVLYRRQLAEVDELVERGLMDEVERGGAHAEAARRLIAAEDAPAAPWTADSGSRRWVLSLAALTPALAMMLYLATGTPGAPDQPYANRLAAWRGADLRGLTAPEIAAVLREATRSRPAEAEGFRLLGLAEGASDNPFAAVRALRRAAALAPGRIDIWRMLGEAEVAEAEGQVDADAQAVFRKVLTLDPRDPGARFYLAKAKGEAGRRDEAAAELKALLPDLPTGDARRDVVRRALADLAGAPAGSPDARRSAMIRGMVDGLAARLKSSPDDPDGWVRLVRAYAVLGDTARRDAAYASARARYQASPVIVEQLDAAARTEPMR